ncbi:MFS transporter [Arthrobacter sp. MMS18-M83]|uniref:MFS transporter n=1 Tax=Arthrobacter sp. MMS18-M83 TaxID=2996261 RepID=UPI00227BF07A|nr:MFS transporter [Arthrobacter sp. MMS18-M83]WAH97329.1 MFS transporter [Arthrobacter sp. MMS18-M83]
MTLPESIALDKGVALRGLDVIEAPIARPATRSLTPWLLIQALVTYGVFGAVQAVLIPNQLSIIDPIHKIGDYATIAAFFATVSVVSQPLIGAFSDRTRSRLGRRALWMLIGAALGAAAMAVMSVSNNVIAVGLCAAVLSLGLNAIIAPMSAVLPDRYPVERRGIASAMIGLGSLLGGTVGSIAAAMLAAQLGIAYMSFAIALLAITVLFLVFYRDFSSKDVPLERFSLKAFVKSFWVSPRKHPEFGWAFLARFLFVLGFASVSTFTFFLLTDYVGLSLDEANAKVGLVGLAALPGMIIAVLLTGILSDKLGRRRIFIWVGSAILIVGVLVPLLMPTVLGIIVMTVLSGFGYGMYQASDVVLMTQVLPKGGTAVGKDLGILNIATGIPQALAPAVAAFVISTVFAYPGLFMSAGIIVFIGAIAIIPIKSVR